MNTNIVIDPGHGGDDSGALGNNIIEKDYTLKISQYIANRLKELGANVYLTRNSDETVNPTERVRRILNAFGNSNDVLVISNHINAGGGDGAEVIYALRGNSNLPNLILNNLEEQGQNIRKAYQRTLPSNPNKDYYFIHRNTGNTEAIIVEYGFLDSNKDDVSQLKNNWIDYAEAVVKSIAEYKNIPYNINNTEYIVKKGDSLWNIAKQFNTSVNQLKKENNLSNNLLKIGQKIVIPNSNNIYLVKKGDSLYKIAKENNVSVEELMKINNLKSSLLTIGQQLIIPTKEKQIYSVKKGDTLYNIAKDFNTTINDLKKLNNLSSDILSINQKLFIP